MIGTPGAHLVLFFAVGGLTAAGCTSFGPGEGTSSTSPSGFLPAGERARVDRVVDGDTVIVGGERVRLIGLDAPESVKPNSPVECFGPEASDALKLLLPNRTPVLLEYDLERRDRYDRVLAYVWLTDPPRLVNLDLVSGGFARVATYRPNVTHRAELQNAEDSARVGGRGLWSGCPQP